MQSLHTHGPVFLVQCLWIGASDGSPYIDAHPDKPEKSDHDSVCDIRCVAHAGQLKPESSVDHAQSDDDSTKPDMCMGDHAASMNLLVLKVMYNTTCCLYKDKGEKDQPDYAVIFVKLSLRISFVECV